MSNTRLTLIIAAILIVTLLFSALLVKSLIRTVNRQIQHELIEHR